MSTKERKVDICPYTEECPTTMWYSSEKRDFVNEVCSTSEHRSCTHFMSLEAMEKIQDLNQVKEYMKNHHLYETNKKKVNPSRRF